MESISGWILFQAHLDGCQSRFDSISKIQFACSHPILAILVILPYSVKNQI